VIICIITVICYPLIDCLDAPATCGTIADCLCILIASSLPCRRRIAVASPSPRRRLASPSPGPPFRPPSSSSHPPSPPHEDSNGDGDRHWHRRSFPYRCCCHHRRRSSRCHLRCLRRRSPDVSVAPDTPAAQPLPPSFMTDPTAVRLRLATVPHQQQRRRWQR